MSGSQRLRASGNDLSVSVLGLLYDIYGIFWTKIRILDCNIRYRTSSAGNVITIEVIERAPEPALEGASYRLLWTQ